VAFCAPQHGRKAACQAGFRAPGKIAKSFFKSLFKSILSPPPLGGLRPPPARSRPPGIPPSQPRVRKPEETSSQATKQPARRHPTEKDGLQRGEEATRSDGTPRTGEGQPRPRQPRARTAANPTKSKRRSSNEKHKGSAAAPAIPSGPSSPECERRWSFRSGGSCSGGRGRRIDRG
jgi:hypothetical protein